MISQEEFARQLQLSDPQMVAGAFSYFQQVKGLGCSGFKYTVRGAVWMAHLESGLDALAAIVRWTSSEVCWEIHFLYRECPVH